MNQRFSRLLLINFDITICITDNVTRYRVLIKYYQNKTDALMLKLFLHKIYQDSKMFRFFLIILMGLLNINIHINHILAIKI